MIDNSIIKELITVLKSGFTGLSLSVTVKQANQPTQQGVVSTPVIYISKIGDRRIGSPQKEDKYDEEILTMVHTETQVYETTFQINALSTQNPSNTTQHTASDLINFAAYILQGESALVSLRAKNIGVLRVTDIRNPYFVNDSDQFQASPSFDVTLTHKQVIITTAPVVVSTEYNVQRV